MQTVFDGATIWLGIWCSAMLLVFPTAMIVRNDTAFRLAMKFGALCVLMISVGMAVMVISATIGSI